jgi:hypothetical protein
MLGRRINRHRLLTRIADHPTCRIDDLIPWNISLQVTPSA